MSEEAQLPSIYDRFDEREIRFIEEYCIDLNQKGAAMRAGVGAKTASAWASKTMRRPEIQQAVDERLQELSKRSIVNAEWVRAKLRTVAERCMQEVPVMTWEVVDGKKVQVESGEYKFDSNGANKALELLGKHIGMFTERAVVTIEHELKQMTPEQLEEKRALLIAEAQTLTLQQGNDGVYAAPAEPVEKTPIDLQPDADE